MRMAELGAVVAGLRYANFAWEWTGFDMFLFVLVSGAVGGQAIARDRENGTLAFLLNLPISRRQVWLAKATAATWTWAVVLAAFSLATCLWPQAHFGPPIQWWLFGAGLGLCALASGLLASAMLDRRLVAALAGLCLTFTLAFALGAAVPWLYEHVIGHKAVWSAGALALLSAAWLAVNGVVVAGSYLLFTRAREADHGAISP